MKKATVKKIIPVYGLFVIWDKESEELSIDPWLVPYHILCLTGFLFLGVWIFS